MGKVLTQILHKNAYIAYLEVEGIFRGANVTTDRIASKSAKEVFLRLRDSSARSILVKNQDGTEVLVEKDNNFLFNVTWFDEDGTEEHVGVTICLE